jgi:hypothetical protein
VVVDDFEVMSASSFPSEADSELIVDPDAVLGISIAAESLETVPRWHVELPEIERAIDLIEFSASDAPELLEDMPDAPPSYPHRRTDLPFRDPGRTESRLLL